MSKKIVENEYIKIEEENIDWEIEYYSITIKKDKDTIIVTREQLEALRQAIIAMGKICSTTLKYIKRMYWTSLK